MDRIHYAGDSCVTGTAIAQALLDYAQALALVGTSATVEIPTLNEDGSPGRSEFLIGPASQLVASEEATTFPEIVDDELVSRMGEESRRLRSYGKASPAAQADDAGGTARGWTEFDI